MKGYTLIELMICIACLGILAATAGVTGGRARELGQAGLQQQEALLALEYRASCLSTGRPVDAAVAARLLAPLPDAVLAVRQDGASATIDLGWRDPFGRPAARALTVFAAPGVPGQEGGGGATIAPRPSGGGISP